MTSKKRYVNVFTFNNKGLADRFLEDVKLPQTQMDIDRNTGKMKVTYMSDEPVKTGDYSKTRLGLIIESEELII